MLVASGVLGFVALVPFSMGVTNLRRDYRLAHDGAMVEGRVDRLEAFEYSTSPAGGGGPFSSRRGTETGIRVHYSFRAANNVAYHDTATPTSPLVKGLSVGGPVRVRYVRSDPDISELESRPLTGYLFTAIGTVFLALVLGVFVAGLRQVGLGVGGRGFTECTATVTELEDVDYIVDSERYIRVRFQFSDAAGNDHWGKGRRCRRRRPAPTRSGRGFGSATTPAIRRSPAGWGRQRFRYRSRMAGQSGTDVAILTPRTIASAATSAARDPIVVSGRSGFWSFRVDTAKS